MAKPIFTSNPGIEVERQFCCWPTCGERADETAPLCRHHMIKVWGVVANEARAALDLLAQRAAASRPRMDGEGYVYFIRFRDRIKIGWTGNLRGRLPNLPHEEILATIPGSMADEKRCHAAFTHLRENGEWFRVEPDLIQFIADISQS